MIKTLKEVNKYFPALLVGGAVRDFLMKKEPKDFDFFTPLKPEDMEYRLKQNGRKVYITGKKFGTIGFTIEGKKIECTTFRKEYYSKDNRNPEVQYTSDIKEDLSRRDFTINAIAMNIKEEIIDPFNGKQDIENKIIRTVGNAESRFKEDPLRMLRAIRFISELNFSITSNTLLGICEKNYKILTVSKERWMQEFDRILMGDNVLGALNILMVSGLLKYILPELSLQYKYNQNSPYHNLDLWTHTCNVVNVCPKDLYIRWGALLHDIGKPFVAQVNEDGSRTRYIKHDLLGEQMVHKLATYLKWSKERRLIVASMVATHMNEDSILKKFDDMFKVKKVDISS